MSAAFSTSTARNIFYGGTVFFFLMFLALTFNTEQQLPQRDQRAQLVNPQVAAGKKLWETNNCIGCHSLLGEGAYFAPELGNVYKRRGPDFIKTWIRDMSPSGVPGRRQMPQFNLTEQQLDDMVEFLKWTGEINTENWPPNIEG